MPVDPLAIANFIASDKASASTDTLTSVTSIITETRIEALLRTGRAAPRFLQGIFPFAGRGVYDSILLHDDLTYVVPAGRQAQVIYFRAGNLSDDLIYLTLTANNQATRYFPVGPKSDFHVPLAIVESHEAGTRLQLCIAAPRGLTGSVVVDLGIVELRANSDGEEA